MTIHIVWKEGEPPEGAFETKKLAEAHIKDRHTDYGVTGYQITSLEVVKIADRPDFNGGSGLLLYQETP